MDKTQAILLPVLSNFDIFCCRSFVILSILFLISVNLCSMLSIHVDVLNVLIISRIDKSPTQILRFVEEQSGQQGLSWCGQKSVYIIS